jgi:hypothetical protein
MSALSEYFNLALGALFLKEDSYEKMRGERSPFVKGLILIVLVGVIVAAVAIVGKVLEWGTTPDLSNLRNIVLQEMQNAPWFRAMARNPQAMQSFQQGYDLWWQIFGSMFGANIIRVVVQLCK